MHHDLHQYVCMSVERDDQGKVTEILFEQNDGSFGSFNGAAVSKDVTKKEPWTDAVSLDDLVDRLWRLIGSRAELTVIPDFRGFDTDRNGVQNCFSTICNVNLAGMSGLRKARKPRSLTPAHAAKASSIPIRAP